MIPGGPLVPIPDGLVRELVDPDVDVVDHDRPLARVFGVVDTEEVETSHRPAVNRQPSCCAVRDRNLLPGAWLLAERLQDRAKIDTLELDGALGRELSVDVVESGVCETYRPQLRRRARSMAAWCSSGLRRRSASSAAAESGSSGRWNRMTCSAASSISRLTGSMPPTIDGTSDSEPA